MLGIMVVFGSRILQTANLKSNIYFVFKFSHRQNASHLRNGQSEMGDTTEKRTEFGQFGQSLNTSLSHKVRVRTDHRSGIGVTIPGQHGTGFTCSVRIVGIVKHTVIFF